MHDRRSQRIREQLRQHPNPRSHDRALTPSFADQLRRTYLPPHAAPPAPDGHAQLARQLSHRRRRF
jgi:hypothetical protein